MGRGGRSGGDVSGSDVRRVECDGTMETRRNKCKVSAVETKCWKGGGTGRHKFLQVSHLHVYCCLINI